MNSGLAGGGGCRCPQTDAVYRATGIFRTDFKGSATLSDAVDDIEAPALRIGQPLSCSGFEIDADSVGERWVPADDELLAALVAIIAMGQALQAANILRELQPARPAFSDADLRSEARITLSVQEQPQTPRTGYPRWQRDGFIFEAISWLAAKQGHGELAYMKDPHVSSTSQGLDGLMIELSQDRTSITRTTVFEDKCTDNPRNTFLQKVIPAFINRHNNRRSAEIIAAASVLLRMAGVDDRAAARLSAAVTDRSIRRYRAAFALTDEHDSAEQRAALFADYNRIENVQPWQRVGAGLHVPPELRDWFDSLAEKGIAYLNSLEEGEP